MGEGKLLESNVGIGSMVRSAVAVVSAKKAEWVEQLRADGVDVDALGNTTQSPLVGDDGVCSVAYVRVLFAPLRAFTASCTLSTQSSGGGAVVFPLMLEATPPKCDDTVVLPLPPGGFHSSAASARSS